MSCPNCAKVAPPGATFCSFCGASLTVLPPPPVWSPSASVQASTTVIEVPIALQVQTAIISFAESASRLELLVRILWSFLTNVIVFLYGIGFGIIVFVYSFVAGILNIIHFIIILITGKRWKTAVDWQAQLIQKSITYSTRISNYSMRRAPYLGLMIDRRPSLEMEPNPATTTGGSPA
jgi:hypothetical protein